MIIEGSLIYTSIRLISVIVAILFIKQNICMTCHDASEDFVIRGKSVNCCLDLLLTIFPVSTLDILYPYTPTKETDCTYM